MNITIPYTVSIVTVNYNSVNTVGDALYSVLSQDYHQLEYIIVDGGSSDGSVEAIQKVIAKQKRENIIFLSENDHGIYDAMNKGIKRASGEIIGILNSDDFYTTPTVISAVVSQFVQHQVQAVFSDLVIVDRNNTDKILRYYDSAAFRPDKFAYGWMPPHPTFFVKKMCYAKYGWYRTDYRIAADYELLVRFLLKHQISYIHLPKVTVKMRAGGLSTKDVRSNWVLNREILRACKENNVSTNCLKIISKYPRKLFQLIKRPEI